MRSLHVFVALLLASLLPGCSSSSSHSNPKTLQSVAVTPAQPSVALGVQQQFKATGMYSDGTSQDLTSTAVWTSSQTAVATISPGGLAITKATGTSSITAMSPSGVSGSTMLTVTAVFGGIVGTSAVNTTSAMLTSIVVTPGNPGIGVTATEQFTATGHFSDSSSLNLTRQVTWSSSEVGVAVINSSGIATPVATGSSTITATLKGVNGSTVLTVH